MSYVISIKHLPDNVHVPLMESAVIASTRAKFASFMNEQSEELMMLVRALVTLLSDTEPHPFHSEPSHSLQPEEGVLLSVAFLSPIGRESSSTSPISRSAGPQMYPNVGVGEKGRDMDGEL